MANEDIISIGDPCPQCRGTVWILNKHWGTTFCGGCGYVTADLKTPIRWQYTNPKTKETYLFEKIDGTIRTVAFLGYKAPNGRLIKRIGG